MRTASVIFLNLLLAESAFAGKPSSSPADPQVAYVILTGPGYELRVTNEDGTNSATLHKSPAPLRFDLAPRNQREIAISDDRTLKLLSYSVSGSGVATSSTDTLYTGPSRIYYVDISPDGRKIAFATRDGQDLMVYDRDQPAGPNNPAVWATVPYVWDVAWYKSGAALTFVVPGSATQEAVDYLYEITTAGSTPTLLFTQRKIDRIDRSHVNSNALVLSYNNPAGAALIGLWEGGAFTEPNMTNRSAAFKGAINCDDTKLIYGAPDKSGSTVWYIRNRVQNSETLYTKTPRVNWAQFWPTCN